MHFNPRSSCEERPTSWRCGTHFYHFNPRSSCEERQRRLSLTWQRAHFNPRSSCEERLKIMNKKADDCKFQSTLLMRGATCGRTVRWRIALFQSTLLMRGATYNVIFFRFDFYNFNPRSSCEERLRRCLSSARHRDFNPRSSCEERRRALAYESECFAISIHAPHARSDTLFHRWSQLLDISIHAPHARSDVFSKRSCCSKFISIHAPHARSDLMDSKRCVGRYYFNPRSSCEERRGKARDRR